MVLKLSVQKRQAVSAAKGFTLVELLLVLAIIAITAASAVVYLIPDSLQHELEREAKRLFQVLRLLEDEAVMQSAEYGVEVFDDGYRFLKFDYESASWSVLNDQRIYRPYRLKEGLFMVLESQAIDQTLANRKTTDNSSENAEATSQTWLDGSTSVDESDSEIKAPPIWVLSSGELTEFKIEIYKQGSRDDPYIILGYETGELELKTPHDD
ncbi:MAG TPA: type II secretion system minor pseudopilin GspH [Pseudomonadales bacterium]